MEPSRGSHKGLISRALTVMLPLSALVLLAMAARETAGTIAAHPSTLGWDWLGLALGLNLVYRAANAANLARVVAALGQRLAVPTAVGVWLGSELMRWIPGGVWGYISRGRLLTRAGLPPAVGAAAIPLELLLTLGAWITVGLGGALAFGMATVWSEALGGGTRPLVIAGIGAGAALLGARLAWPRIRSHWAPLEQVRVRTPQALLAYLFYVALNAFRGLGLFCVIEAVTQASPVPLGVVVSANAIAWVLGFVVVFAPGGLGVREAGIVVLLAGWLPVEQAALAALIWRATQLAEEMLLLPVALLTRTRPPGPIQAPLSRADASKGRVLLSWIAALFLVGFSSWFILAVLIPGWRQSTSRSFDSPLGFGRVVRAAGGGFELPSTTVQRRTFTTRYLGEGRLQSESVLVPIIPMAVVSEVLVEVGQGVTEGQVLIRLDDSRAQVHLAAARAVVGKAQAELERRRVGSHHTQLLERPEIERLNLEHRQREKELADEILALYQSLAQEGVISRVELIDKLYESSRASREASGAQVSLETSEQGRGHAQTVAEMTLEEARAAESEREIELAEHAVRAPVDGVIRELLILPGEFNRNPGKTGLVLSTGMWFEARLGQSALAGVEVGAPCEVQLEAYPGQGLPGTLEQIIPFVDNDLAGPETTRPIRPRGTGAPEWPSTFRIRIQFDPLPEVMLVPGLTGHAAIVLTREGLGIPDAGVDAFSPAEGLVFAVDGELETLAPVDRAAGEVHAAAGGRWVNWGAKRVRIGRRSGGWVEVLEGLEEGDEVLLGGHGVLKTSDRVRVISEYEEP